MECFTAIVGGIAGKIADFTFLPIQRHVSYFIFYNRKIKNLEDENNKLGHKKAEAKEFMNDADRKFKKPAPSVSHWQNDAEKLNEEVSQFLQTVTGQSNKCCQSPWSRYSSSRKVFKMTEDVSKKLGETPPFLSNDIPPPNIGSTFNLECVKDFDSRISLMNEILKALLDDKLNMISICGMGGVGKTTLAKKIVRIVESEKLFDLVAMTTVSQKPNFDKIQSDIISCFGWKFEDVDSEHEKARKLHQKLKECDQTILLIFDDVWKELTDEDFEAIGLPSTSAISGCKIILTSRKVDVCNRMGSQKIFPILDLSDEEAWSLFKEMALVENSIDIQDLHQTAMQISGECGGLPIAIVTVAKALKNKKREIWNDALLQLKSANPKGIIGMDKAVYSRIELSYDLLERQEAKSCFLLCCLFPEDHNVPIELLVWYGMGLRLFQNIDNLQQARDRVHVLVDELKESFLVLNGDDFETIKMHDLVRDVALFIAAKERHAYLVQQEAGMRSPETNSYKDYKAISLFYEGKDEHPVPLKCLKLELLLCEGKRGYHESLPNNFFEGMEQLKVLQLSVIKVLPQSLKGLEKLRTLICDSFENIKILGDLGNLEILAIRNWHLRKLPKEIGLLRNLRLLDLHGVHGLKYFPSGLLRALSKLEELYVSHGFNWWEFSFCDDKDERINASLSELEYLHITTLQICVPKPSFLPTQTVLASLKRFNIRIGNEVESTLGAIHKRSVNRLYIEGDTDDGGWFNALSRETEDLTLMKVKNIKKSRFAQLRKILIDGSDELEYLVDNKHISRSHDIGPASFSNLKKIDITSCAKLKYVFPLSMAKSLSQLQSICIQFCSIIEGIFCGKEVDDEIEFPNLISLDLRYLPKLIGLCADTNDGGCIFLSNQFNDDVAATSVSSTYRKVVLESDSAEEASTSYVVNQSSFNHVLFPSTWNGFSNLQWFKLVDCDQLEVAFPPNVAEQMVQLKTLQVMNCLQMQYIIGNGRSQEEKYRRVFPNLVGFYCQGLPELVAFCVNSNHVFLDCHLLETITITDCPKIKASILFEWINEGPSTLNTSVPDEDNEVKKAEPSSTIRGLIRRKGRKQQKDQVSHINSSTLSMEKSVKKTQHHVSSQDYQILFHIVPDPMMLLRTQKLQIENCNNLIYLFSPHVAKLLVKLEFIGIKDCEKMEAIVGKEHEEAPESTLDKIVFPQLREIELFSLHNLRSFYGGIYAMEFPLLESIAFLRCNQMKTFSLGFSLSTPILERITVDEKKISLMGDLNTTVEKMMWGTIKVHDMEHVVRIGHDHFLGRDSSKCLFLDIRYCEKLLNAIPCNLMANFQSLKELHVDDCDSLEEIFEHEGGSAVTFSHLEQIVLEDLPSLKHIFHNIPKEIARFQKLRVLKLSDCYALRNVFSVSVAKGLLQLQELVLFDCHGLKEVVVKDNEEEEETSTQQIVFPQLKLLHIEWSSHFECFYSGIHALEFPLLETLILPDSDRLKNFSNGLVSTPKLKKVTTCEGKYTINGDLNATISGWYIKKMEETIRIYDMEHVVRIGYDQFPCQDSSKCLFLDIRHCKKLLNAIPYNLIASFQNLKELHVHNCDSLEEIFEYEGGSAVTFSYLEEILLEYLPSVQHILNKIPKEIAGFQKLRILKFSDCYALRNVFSVSVARLLLQLQKLVLQRCFELKEVVVKEDEEEEETSTHQIVFPQLRLLHIEWSSHFECFYSGIHALEFPLLETLILPDRLKNFSNGLVSTPKLEKITIREGEYTVNGDLNATIRGWFSKKMVEALRIHDKEHVLRIGHDLFPDRDLSNCRFLNIRNCEKLLNVIPYNLMANFQNLKELHVDDCDSLEEIFEYEGGSAVIFSHLEQIVLEDLPNLKHIFNNIPKEIVGFQKLRILKLSDCYALRNVFSVSVAKGLLQLQELVLRVCRELKEVVAKDDEEEEGTSTHLIVFAQLRLLHIEWSSHFECFYSGIYALEFPLLETLVLPDSNRLKNFSNGLVSTPKLEKVTIDVEEYPVNRDLNATVRWFIKKKGALSSSKATPPDSLFLLSPTPCSSLYSLPYTPS